jgi:predicted polyphosphate/ATP-dependent NAD kinase
MENIIVDINTGVTVVEEFTPEQIARAAEHEAAEKQRIEAEAPQKIREERNKRLADTDWRVTYEVERAAIDGLGIQYPQVWADYRQALRDITAQPGFPHNVMWPKEPVS